MNNLTKEELENIVTCVRAVSYNNEQSAITLKSAKDKLESMIDNYCEHLWVSDSTHMPFGTICVSCSKRGYDDNQ